jgi:hypothetical protein
VAADGEQAAGLAAGGLMGNVLTLGGFTTPGALDASDYIGIAGGTGAAFQAALDACPRGGSIYAPIAFGPWTPPSAAGWIITKPVTIFSDGPGVLESSCFTYYNSLGAANKDSVLFTIDLDATIAVKFRDLTISNNAGFTAASGTGDAIRIVESGTLTKIAIENCNILYAGRSGLYINGTNLVWLTIRDTKIYGCGGHGMYLGNCHLIDMGGVVCTENKGMGTVIFASGNGISIHACDFEFNGQRLDGVSDSTIPEDNGLAYNAQLYFGNCDAVHVSGCNIEGTNYYFGASGAATLGGITLNGCKGCVIGGNEINNSSSTAGTFGVKLINGAACNTILSNNIGYMAASVAIDDMTNDIGNVIFPQAVTGDATGPGVVLLPTDDPNTNFVFQTNIATASNNKGVGLLLPQMSSAAAIDAGALKEGLLFYDFTSKTVKRRDDNSTDVVP